MLRNIGPRIVFTNGCFDGPYLHRGHISTLQFAAEQGHMLIVAVNTDASVRALKGEECPVFSLVERCARLQQLSYVTIALPFAELTTAKLLEAIRPAVIVKGAGSDLSIERQHCAKWGGYLFEAPYVEGFSTTRILAEMGKVGG